MKLRIAEIPYLLSGLGTEMTGIAEVALQLQVAPVIERVADGLLQGLCPLLELLTIRCIAGDVVLIYAVGAHLTPLVVVAAQPYLGNVVELSVLGNLLGIDVAVVIYDGHALGILMEQLLGCFRRK